MPKLRLTSRAIDRLPAPDPSGKQTLYWDSELRGFGVLVSGKTTNKTLPLFYKAAQELPSPIARDYLLLILFTGFRRREAAALRWSEVDFEVRVIRLPAARAKAGRKLDLPMSDFVYALLADRRSLGDAAGWVFPANSRSGHIQEPKFPLRAIAAATGIQVSVHDLRRTFVTVAESTDMSVLALKALVNHSLGKDVTSGYYLRNG